MKKTMNQSELRTSVRKIVENSMIDIIRKQAINESKKRKMNENFINTMGIANDVPISCGSFEGFKVYSIRSFNAMKYALAYIKKLGKKCRWCLKREDMFNHYHEIGNLYFIIGQGEVYMAFVPRGENRIQTFSDSEDNILEPSEILPEKLISKLESGKINFTDKRTDESRKRKKGKMNEDTENFRVLPINSLTQMNKFGKNLGWCTTEKQYFDAYSQKGTLVGVEYQGKKYLSLVENGKITIFSDENDTVMEPSEVLPQEIISRVENI